MEQKLDFSLPEKKKNCQILPKLALIILTAILVLCIVTVVKVGSLGGGGNGVAAGGGDAEQTKQLASKLAARGLYDSAVKVWQQYLDQTQLAGEQKARVLYQIGSLLEKVGKFEEAIEYYYRCEMAAKLDDMQKEINDSVKRCFERLGRFSALKYEMMDRTSYKSDEPAGGEVVAEIGLQKIMLSQLDGLVEEQIEKQLGQYASFMPAEQLAQQKKKMLSQFATAQSKIQFLQGYIAQEVLYRHALDKGFADKDEVKKTLDELRKNVLSQQVVTDALASKINITESDVQTYYQANRDKYVEKAKAKISHILVESESKAKEVMGKLEGGEDFAEIAKQFSIDDATKDNGGAIDADVEKGSQVVAGIGQVEGLVEMIFAAEAGKVLDEPVKTEKGFEIVKVESKQESRQKEFDEVAQQVQRELNATKSQEVQQQLIKGLMDEYEVVIHTSVLGGNEPEQK